MGYKKQNWIKIGKAGLKIEVTILDEDWRKIEIKKCNADEFPKLLSHLNQKYNIPINKTSLRDEVEEELSFLKKQFNK